jgi:hypothetical protein
MSVAGNIARWAGLVLLGVVGWFYLSSGLVAPAWAVVLLLAVWVGLLVLAMRLWRSRPWAVLVIPFVAVLIWVVALLLGQELLGWTA